MFLTQQSFAVAYGVDSLGNKNLKEVTVNGQHQQLVRSALPIQLFSEKEIGNLNASSVSDVAKHFAGVTVKDYGGIGGLKTVSLRGLGALHTGVSYDGVMMSDIQTGQIDLGRFSIENISAVSLNNGQPNDIFQPARMFASSGVLCFSTKMPAYDSIHTFSGRLTAKTGSFGMYNPSIYLCKNISKIWGISLSSDGLMANGEYKYLTNLNNNGGLNLVEKTRINTDVQSIRSELNSLCRLNDFESISMKLNHFYSERGLPDADLMYSNYFQSLPSQRLLDENYLAQLHYENKKSCFFQYQSSGKFNHAFMKFSEVNANYPDLTDHKRIDDNSQNEYYITTSAQYFANSNLSFCTAIDWWYNDLFSHSNLRYKKDAAPNRNTELVNFATKYVNESFNLAANLLYTATEETTQSGSAAPNREKLSPTLSLSYKIFDNREFRIRAFYKNIFRLPTFSDLYFHDFGYVNLRPEQTDQFNFGLVYNETELPLIQNLEMSADAYYNKITDKITVIYGMPYSSIRNLEKVEIRGVDLNLKTSVPITKNSTFNLHANYTFQLAQNMTVGSDNYLEQIPYTPFHSGSGSIAYHYQILEAGYNLLYAGERWSGQNVVENRLNSYIEHSLFAKYYCKKYKLMGELINLFDAQYQIIKDYPMPGRNYRITLTMDL